MIQRIQTVYLFIAVLITVAAQFLSVIEVNAGGGIIEVNPWVFESGDVVVGSWPAGILWVLFAALNVITVFAYKNRVKQMRFVRYSYFILFLIVLFETALIYLWYQIPDVEISYGTHLIMPLAAFIFNFLARRNIKKDEQLVRSVDRLR